MPITVVTGAPGSGKTLLTIAAVEARRIAENRDVYYNGIPGLNLPWIEFDNPEDWNTLPIGAIIVIDECQRFLRPRFAGSKVPKYVEDFETHRHKGYDIYLPTQHPLLIDANVRRLAETHIHIMRKFGSQLVSRHEWKGVKENCDKSRADAVSTSVKLPKDFFGAYKSAEIHTIKTRIPHKIVAAVVGLPLLLAASAYVIGDLLQPDKPAAAAAQSKNAISGSVSGAPSPASSGVSPSGIIAAQKTPEEYLKQFKPLIVGLPHTAPRYEELTKPVRVPTIRGCWITDKPLEGFEHKAVCMLDGGVYVYPPESFVQAYLRDRFFIDWENPRAGDLAAASPRQGDAATAGKPLAVSPGLSLGGN